MEIKPYSKNAKKHPRSQLEALAKVVAEIGWRQNVEVNLEGIIIAGHGRYFTWLEFKDKYNLPDIWIMDVTGKTIFGKHDERVITKEQEDMWRLADNKLNESEWDMGLAIEELKGLSDKMFALTGFDKDLLIEPDEKDDEIPENVPSRSKLGDLYELGQHRVLCGDSTQIEAVLRLCGGNKVDMYLTDPPYNVAYEGGTGLTIQNDDMQDGEFRQFLIDAFTTADTVMKAGAVFYIWHADSEGYNFRGACHDIGWKVRQCLIWNKSSLVMGRQDYQWKHEPCLYGWKDGASHLWNSDRTQTTVLNFDKPSRNAEHPTMKPVELFAYQITNNTKGEDIVFDNFLGSGTTLIASQKTGRICYGMELDPKYIDVIVQRYVDYTGNKNIKLNGNDIIWEKSQKTTK